MVMDAEADSRTHPDFLARGGEMGALMRAYDWASTPLGPPETWPLPLRITIRLLLNTGHPMYLFWGPDGISFYNDPYRQTLGQERHPFALGRPAREVWEEIWPIIGPQIDQVMSGRGATWHENQLIPTTRNGRVEDVYWTYSYCPIGDEDAPHGVGGVLVVCNETTAQVLSERRLAAQAERQRRVFEQAPGFICVLSGPEHVFEFANQAYVRILGGRELLGRTSGAGRTIAYGLMPVGALLAGVIGEQAGIRPVLVGAAVVTALAALYPVFTVRRATVAAAEAANPDLTPTA